MKNSYGGVPSIQQFMSQRFDSLSIFVLKLNPCKKNNVAYNLASLPMINGWFNLGKVNSR